jgi:hypothetical protein
MVPTEFLRGILGILALGCAFMSGRTLAAVRQGALKPARHYAWLIRTVVCLAALSFRHPIGTLELVVWICAAVGFGGGWWQTSHRKPPEDLTDEMFPHRHEDE